MTSEKQTSNAAELFG